jgi:hypothetical protein
MREGRIPSHTKLDRAGEQFVAQRYMRAHRGKDAGRFLEEGEIAGHEFVDMPGRVNLPQTGEKRFHIHTDTLSIPQAQEWITAKGLWKDTYTVLAIKLVPKRDERGRLGHFVLVGDTRYFTVDTSSKTRRGHRFVG